MDQSDLMQPRYEEEETEDQVEDDQIPHPRRSLSKLKVGGHNSGKRRSIPQRQRSSRLALDKMSITERSNEDDSEEIYQPRKDAFKAKFLTGKKQKH